MPTPKTGALPLGDEFSAEFFKYFFLKIKKSGSKSVKRVPKINSLLQPWKGCRVRT
tara:strand:+ start:373 stop:540 length:168 start_codon:yes stop_codon:yes gene_type:complete